MCEELAPNYQNNIDRMFEEIYTEPEIAHIAEIERLAYERKKKEVVDAEHRVGVENAIIRDLSAAISQDYAKNNTDNPQEIIAISEDVVYAMCAGKIRNVTINY